MRITVDDRAPEHFAVMAGIGMDAMIMEETDEDLKDKVGSAAYFVAAGKALGRLPVRMTVQLDTNRPVRRHAMLCVIGNVGALRGNLTLIPGASPDDGLLDLYNASPADSGTGPSLRYGSLPDVPRRLPLAATAGLPVEFRIIGVHQLMLSGFFMCDCVECRSCITTTVSRRSSSSDGVQAAVVDGAPGRMLRLALQNRGGLP